jgi:hypothetical protein
MNERLQPALWGGVFIGVLSSLPLIEFGNCCCCLWVLAGGALAAYLRQQSLPYQIAAAEGALVGLMAGAVGAVIATAISIPVQMVTGPMMQAWIDRLIAGNPDMPPELRDAMSRTRVGGAGGWVLGLLASLIIYPIFALLGGLLGSAIFKKNLPPPPPPGTIDVPPVAPPPAVI